MKSQLCSVLFALVVSISAACGGDRDNSTPTEPTPPPISKPELVTEPVVERAPIDVKLAEPIVEIAMPTKYVDAMALGKQLAERGEHPRAREIFEAATRLDKKQADPFIELARSYITTNDRALAIRSATKAVKLAPSSSQAYNTLGRAELLRHSYDNAIEAFRQATELNADNVWAWNNLGYTHLLLEEYQEAADALVEATSRKGTTGYMWNNLGTAYEHLDELDEARTAFEQGGKLGSTAAKASRARLEGVDTIVVMTDRAEVEPKGEGGELVEYGYEHSEPMPEPIAEPEVIEDELVEDEVVDEAGVLPVAPEAEEVEEVEEVEDEPKLEDDQPGDVPAIF